MVAGLHFAAVFVELLGADLTAAAVVPDQPDSRGALGRLQRAVAGSGAGGESLEEGEKTREAVLPCSGEAPKLPWAWVWLWGSIHLECLDRVQPPEPPRRLRPRKRPPGHVVRA